MTELAGGAPARTGATASTAPRRARDDLRYRRRRGRLREATSDTRFFEFIFGMLLVADGMLAPGLGFPFSLIALAALVTYGLANKPRLMFRSWAWVPWLLTGVLVYLAMLSVLSHQSVMASDWTRRWVRIAAIVLTAAVIATERVHVASVLRGLTVGLLLNIVLYYLRLTPDNYPGYLTGFLLDKNKAGMFYAVAGVLLLWQARQRFTRVILTAVLAVPVWLTGSRTSMTAYALGIAWTWLATRRPVAIRWALAIGAYFLVNFVEANYSQAGQFADRVGSDLLRARIGAAVEVKVSGAPPQGLGLGEAYVMIGGDLWYFHDSFATLRVEGGYFYLAAIVFITVWVGLRPFKSFRPAYQGMVAQGAALTVMMCATKLGEVFMTIPWALALGVALNYVLKGEPQSERAGADVDGFMRDPQPLDDHG